MSIKAIQNMETGLICNLQGGRIDYADDDTLVWAPYRHGSIALLKDSGSWSVVTISNSIQFRSSDYDYFGTSLTYGVNYDVFASYFNSSIFKLHLVPWASDTERAHALELYDGVWVFEGMRFLGSVRLIDSGGPSFVDSALHRLVVNLNNKKPKYVSASLWGNSSWRSQTTSWQEFSVGGSITRGDFLALDPNVSVIGASALYRQASNAGYADFHVGLALNSTTEIIGVTSSCIYTYSFSDGFSSESLGYGSPRLGWNWITVLTKVSNASYYMDYHSYNGEIGKAVLQITS